MTHLLTASLFVTSGALWFGWGLLSFGTDVYGCSSVRSVSADLVFGLAGVLLSVALLQLAVRLAGPQRWTAGVGGVAAAAMSIGNGIDHCMTESFSLMYVLGAAGLWVATILFGIATLRSGPLPRWLGPFLVAAMLAFGWAGDSVGWLVFGLAWVVLGLVLLRVTEVRPEPATEVV